MQYIIAERAKIYITCIVGMTQFLKIASITYNNVKLHNIKLP